MCAIVVSDDVDRSWLGIWVLCINELLSVHEGFTLGSSEDQLSESCTFFTLNDTSNSFDVDEVAVSLDKSLLLTSLVSNVLDIAHDVLVQLRDHLLSDSEHLVAVFDVHKSIFTFLQSDILILDELVLLGNFFHDLVKEQVNGLSLVVLDSVEMEDESIDIVWWSDGNDVSLALVLEISQLSLSFLALLDLLGE